MDSEVLARYEKLDDSGKRLVHEIGQLVLDAVAAKDAEIERLRAENTELRECESEAVTVLREYCELAEARLAKVMEALNIESLASIQHNIWSHWMRWFFSHDDEEGRARWRRQMVTPYSDLSESERESDRRVVREFFAPILAAAQPKEGDVTN